MAHCVNVTEDRKLGEYWERAFCKLAAREGFVCTLQQAGRDKAAIAFRFAQGRWEHFTLADVVLWGRPNQQHEIKHKAPTAQKLFGLEEYRFRALLAFARTTGDGVYYTIHNHQLSGGRDSEINDINHWVTANVLTLDGRWRFESVTSSYVDGRSVSARIYYWPQELFMPLAQHFKGHGPRPGGQRLVWKPAQHITQLKAAA